MKLLELLEQGKKATRDGVNYKYLYTDGVDILNDKGSVIILNYCILSKNDWYEYKEYQTNFEFEDDDVYTLDSHGELLNVTNVISNAKITSNFNAFPNKELAVYVHKKQLLERKLIIFSYLNGADEIDWKDYGKQKHYIDATNIDYEGINIKTNWNTNIKSINNVYFKNKEIRNKAMQIYKDDIEEVIRLSLKFGF